MLRVTPALGETSYLKLLEPLGVNIRPEREASEKERLELWTDAASLGSAIASGSSAPAPGDAAWHAEAGAKVGVAEYRVVLVMLNTGSSFPRWCMMIVQAVIPLKNRKNGQ